MSKAQKTINDDKRENLPEIIFRTGSPFGKGISEKESDFFDSGFQILITAGAEAGKVFPLDRREVNLGKKDTASHFKAGSIFFSDSSISNQHAVLRWDEDMKKYIIYHLSNTSPTLVNGRAVKKSMLNSDYEITMGGVTFKIVSVEEKRRQESACVWEDFKKGEIRGEKRISTGYNLVVVEGPDKGESFPLDKNLLIIGRRKGPGDLRDSYGVLLSDKSIPEELALVVWDEKIGRFSLYRSAKSSESVKIYRVGEDPAASCIVGRNYENILQDKDTIIAGETVLAVHLGNESETENSKVDIEKELSAFSEGEDSQKDTVLEKKPRKLLQPNAGTASGSFRVDYVFETIAGRNTGTKISFLSDEIKDGRVITFGSWGEGRQNDMEVNDPAIANNQGYFEFSQGVLYMVNEVEGAEIFVNSILLSPKEKIALNGGDRIQMGETTFAFTDNRVLAGLKNYRLVQLPGKKSNRAVKFPISKTMIFIGRGSSCDVRVLDPEVSRLHAVLTFKGGHFHLEHKSKVNPTFANGVSLRKGQDRIIFVGDKIYLSANTVLQLVREEYKPSLLKP